MWLAEVDHGVGQSKEDMNGHTDEKVTSSSGEIQLSLVCEWKEHRSRGSG